MLLASLAAAQQAGPRHGAAVEDRPADDADVRQWTADLGNPSFNTREAATKALIAAGPAANRRIHEALASDDLEVRMRAERVADALERRAVEYLKRRRCRFGFDEAGAPAVLSIQNLRLEAEDMRHVACLRRLVAINAIDAEFGDDFWRGLDKLTSLQDLRLQSTRIEPTNVTDDSLEHIGRLRQLRVLTLPPSRITDAGLAHLTKLDSLTVLNIRGARLEGRGLAELARLPSLEELVVAGCPFDDRSLAEGLRAFPPDGSLRTLRLQEGPLSDAVLPVLARIRSLESVDLASTQVSDNGLAALAGLPRLERLGLRDTSVGDAGMKDVAALPALKHVDVFKTKVSLAGLLKLAESPALRGVVQSVKLTRSDTMQFRKRRPRLSLSGADPFANPFGGGGPPPAPPGADPFGGAAASDPFAPADPFGAVPASGPGADPFGGGAAPVPVADPFAPAADPFGGGSAPPDPFSPDPFGDPFGESAPPAADPFADPF